MSIEKKIRLGVFLCAVLLGGHVSAEEKYPEKTIQMIVPFSHGGTTDLLARVLASYISDDIGQSVVVDNRGGGGGSLGMERLARAQPDGYTIGMATMSTHGSNPALYKSLRYDPLGDFEAIVNIAAIPSVLMVNPSVPAETLREFIALAKNHPGKYSFGSPGVGSLGHANMENFMMLSGVEMLHVPYRGAGPAVIDAIAGQIQVVTDTLSTALPNIKSGKLRPLALLGAKRSSLIPNIPTFAEEGFQAMGTGGWFGLIAPAGTPKFSVDSLNASVRKVAADPEFQRKMDEIGANLQIGSPQDFRHQIESAIKQYKLVAKKANISID